MFLLTVTFSLAIRLACDVPGKLQFSQCLMSGNSQCLAKPERLRSGVFPTKMEFPRTGGSRLHPMMMVPSHLSSAAGAVLFEYSGPVLTVTARDGYNGDKELGNRKDFSISNPTGVMLCEKNLPFLETKYLISMVTQISSRFCFSFFSP